MTFETLRSISTELSERHQLRFQKTPIDDILQIDYLKSHKIPLCFRDIDDDLEVQPSNDNILDEPEWKLWISTRPIDNGLLWFRFDYTFNSCYDHSLLYILTRYINTGPSVAMQRGSNSENPQGNTTDAKIKSKYIYIFAPKYHKRDVQSQDSNFL